MRNFVKLSIIFFLILNKSYAHHGHQDWSNWRFDWAVEMNSGLSIKNVYYNNEKVFYRASLPVIRVKYYGNHSTVAYEDKLNWGNMKGVSWCNNAKVCTKTYTAGGKNWLEIGIYVELGKYQLYQSWNFSADGYLNANMFSKGLHHDDNHTHHPYFRLDADINGSSNNQSFVFSNRFGNEGWGNHWHKYTNEGKDNQNSRPEQVYFVREKTSGHGLWILPRVNDGKTDDFSTGHLFNRLYKGSEDVEWAFGAWDELKYDEGENIQEKDIVLWYVPHLYHDHSDHGDQWHSAGPTLKVHR